MLAILSLTTAALTCPVSDLFVDASANCGAADGTAAAPYCTISEAVAAALSGDVIRVAPATYSEELVFTKDLTVLGDPSAPFVMDGASLLESAVLVQSGARVALENLEVTGFQQEGSTATIENIDGGSLVLRNASVWQNGELFSPNPTIRRRQGAGDLLIYDSYIANNLISYATVLIEEGAPGALAGAYGSFLGGGIGISVGGQVIRSDDDFVLEDSAVQSSELQVGVFLGGSASIRNSTIGSSNAAIVTYSASTVAATIDVAGCTIVGSMLGIAHGGSQTFGLRNSIVSSGQTATLDGAFLSNGNNLIRNKGASTGFLDGVNGDIVGTAAAPINPRFGPTLEYGDRLRVVTLLPTSPAIDAGSADPLTPRDQRGRLRLPEGVDIGAYELDLDVTVNLCTQPPTSAGTVAEVRATGAFSASTGAVRLTATGLPPGVSAIFFMGTTLGSLPVPPGALGVCLGGQIGRLVGPGQVLTSDPAGRIDLRINTSAIPQGSGTVPAQAGQTWYFQGWHRDVSQGMASFGFTGAAGITFR